MALNTAKTKENRVRSLGHINRFYPTCHIRVI